MSTNAPLLGSYIAKYCPKRVALDYDALLSLTKIEPTPAQRERMDRGIQFETAVKHLLHTSNPNMVLIPSQRKYNPKRSARRERLTLKAMQAGAELIWNPRLPADVEGRRVGEPDLLVRGPKRRDGKWSYRPVDVKWHKARSGKGKQTVLVSTLDKPTYAAGRKIHNMPAGRLDDELQLAHYLRMLEACGHSQPDRGAIGGVLGRDNRIWWTDLSQATRRHTINGKTSLMTMLDVYDHEFAVRLAIVDAARARTEGDPMPVAMCTQWSECKEACPYRDYKYAELVSKDALTLLTRLTQAQVDKLAAHGVTTRRALAELSDTEVAELGTLAGVGNLAWHAATARAVVAGECQPRDSFQWFPTHGENARWIDIDMENDPESGIVYMWGVRTAENGYHAFADWSGSPEGEAQVFAEFWAWLQSELANPVHTVAYCYTGAEERCLRYLADKHAGVAGVPAMSDIDALVNGSHWSDLFDFVKTVAWPTESLSIKYIARECGFAWRDSSPSGEESVLWYQQAKGVGAVNRKVRTAAKTRLLTYNEDDVIAMEAIRNHAARTFGKAPALVG